MYLRFLKIVNVTSPYTLDTAVRAVYLFISGAVRQLFSYPAFLKGGGGGMRYRVYNWTYISHVLPRLVCPR